MSPSEEEVRSAGEELASPLIEELPSEEDVSSSEAGEESDSSMGSEIQKYGIVDWLWKKID